jgi:hypothetical protein
MLLVSGSLILIFAVTEYDGIFIARLYNKMIAEA